MRDVADYQPIDLSAAYNAGAAFAGPEAHRVLLEGGRGEVAVSMRAAAW